MAILQIFPSSKCLPPPITTTRAEASKMATVSLQMVCMAVSWPLIQSPTVVCSETEAMPTTKTAATLWFRGARKYTVGIWTVRSLRDPATGRPGGGRRRSKPWCGEADVGVLGG